MSHPQDAVLADEGDVPGVPASSATMANGTDARPIDATIDDRAADGRPKDVTTRSADARPPDAATRSDAGSSSPDALAAPDDHDDGLDGRYRTILQNIQDYAIYAVDPEGYITEWTEGAQRV